MHFPYVFRRMRRLASACVGASACYVVASKASAVQREAGAESVVHTLAEAAFEELEVAFAPLVERSAWPAVLRGGARVIAPRCGDIAVYDCRTYHRGLGNSTTAGRPALVFRYDFEATPPPCVGLLGSVAHTSLARALHVASSCGLAMREAVT